MKPFLSVLLMGITVAGCTSLPTLGGNAPLLSPPTTQNPAPLPDRFTTVVSSPTIASDPILQALLNQAAANAPDIAIAQQRLVEAQARLGVARAGLLPSLTATTQISAQDTDGAKATNSGSAGTNLQVPLDFFGATRARADGARARAEEARYNKDRIEALTRATLTQLYISLRTAQAQTDVTRANLERANDSLSLATTRQRAGLETGLGVAQATSNRDAIAARLPAFAQSEAAARLGLEALVGQAPATWKTRLDPAKPIPRFDVSLSNIAPQQWLTSRADLVAGEFRLRAAGLDAKAARRDRYPNVSLQALLNQTEANQGPTGLTGSVAINLVSTLFDFGRLEALARAASANAAAEAQIYRQLVLNAAADVESQASRVGQGNQAIEANRANVASSEDQANLARVRYTSGLSSFLDVLTAQRAVYEAQSELVRVTGDTASAEVALNLALGF
jgi:outer membrane protein, multidrug efflux system